MRIVTIRKIGLLACTVAILAGCASLPPAQPATNLSAIAGEWKGDIWGAAGTTQATMTIKPDGHYIVKTAVPVGPNRISEFQGTVTVEGGKYRYKSATTGNTGTFTLHQDANKKMLKSAGDTVAGGGEYTFVK